ncbi:hypothetical protein AU210_016104 [Fusarium oxysporum f. sp. radicis-cucumerinum]|uniref:Uncharacterized protein n=1 Tax=Fusarium oxysporum f. sp. radicis-cucumerinum TaxID=327505 RepID=A0A2H3FSV4_FUSOX|nr:hypothetical protein AU210_016104 [Fusarium oxysporum f. sp. radicis-cucumerinum]
MIQEGFGKLENNYTKTDPMAVRHLNQAYNCLIDCLGDPLCDMMLLLALTFGDAAHRRAGKRILSGQEKEGIRYTGGNYGYTNALVHDERSISMEDTDEKLLSVAKMTQEIGK